jgi:very-short-patch-repair endonuclease
LHGRKFRRQYSIGPYVLDFYCPEEQLGIEIDGTVHQDPWRYEYEEERTTFFITQGIRFARFENRQVLEQRAVVLEAIAWHFRNTPTEEEAYLP